MVTDRPEVTPGVANIIVHRGPMDGAAVREQFPETSSALGRVQPTVATQPAHTDQPLSFDRMASSSIPRPPATVGPSWVEELVASIRGVVDAPPQATPAEKRPEVLCALGNYKAAQAREGLMRVALEKAEAETKALEFKYIDERDAAERRQRDEEGAMLRAKKGIAPETKGDAHFWMPWRNEAGK